MSEFGSSNYWDNDFEMPKKRICYNQTRGRSPRSRGFGQANLYSDRNCMNRGRKQEKKNMFNWNSERGRASRGRASRGRSGKFSSRQPMSGQQYEEGRDVNRIPVAFKNSNEGEFGVHMNLVSNQARRNVPSLPSIYRFSWDAFAEPSYVDNIVTPHEICSNQMLGKLEISREKTTLSNNYADEPISETSLKATVNALSEMLKDDTSNRDNSAPVSEGFNTVQELIDSKCCNASQEPYNSTYSELMDLLTTASEQIEEARRSEYSLEAQDRARQHKLLLVALLGQATPSSSIYKESGASGSQWMFRKIHLVGDSRIHDVGYQITDNGTKIGRPFLHCKTDLSFFSLSSFLNDVIPKSSVKNRMLVVCSVGLWDVVRTIDEFGVLVSIEVTLAEMKRIRKEFHDTYGPDHELIFADILPANMSQIFNIHKDSMLANDDCETREQLTKTTIKLVKFTYLLAKNMMAEDLSRFKHLPPWEIFANPIEMKVEDSAVCFPGLKDGLNPDTKGHLSQIPKRVKTLFTLYNDLKDAPNYNGVPRDIYFVCNEKYAAMEKFWPKAAALDKPTFLFLEEVISESIIMNLRSYFPLPKSSVLVVWFDVSEVLTTHINKDCERHSPLKLFVPRFLPPSQIFDELTLVRKELQNRSDTSNVVFTTLCPIDYNQLFENAITSHKVLNHVLERPADATLTRINNYLLAVIDKVNMYIIQSNRMRGLPAWDLCSHLYKRGKDGLLSFQPPISPSGTSPVEPVTVAKIMMCLGQCGPETIKALNWLEYKSTAPPSQNVMLKRGKMNASKANYRKRDIGVTLGDGSSQFGSRGGWHGSTSPRKETPTTVRYDSSRGWDGIPHRRNSPPDLRSILSQSSQNDARNVSDNSRSHTITAASQLFDTANETSNSHIISAPPQLYGTANETLNSLTISAAPHLFGAANQTTNIGMDPQLHDVTAHETSNTHTTSTATGASAAGSQNPVHLPRPTQPFVPRNFPMPRSGLPTFMPSAQAAHPPVIRPPPLLRPPALVSQRPTAFTASSKPPTPAASDSSNKGQLPTGSRMKISFGIKSKEEERIDLVEGVEEKLSAPSPPPVPSLGVTVDRATLEQLVASLRDAHNSEVVTLRANPHHHSRYEDQRRDFLEQAVKHCFENNETPNITSIERVWEVFWKMQLEKSFVKTWDKRVNHLVQVLAKEQELSQETKAHLDRLTKLEPGVENEAVPDKFSVSESNLLNKFKKHRSNIDSSCKEVVQKNSCIVLGEKMLNEVQKGWKTIGCKQSKEMLDNAVSKIHDFMAKPNVEVNERVQFINLGIKLKNLKEFLISKQDNPYDLDYKSIAEITMDFTQAEMAEYVAGVINNKGIDKPAVDDIIVICKAITDRQRKKKVAKIFVKGGVINT